MQKLDTVLVKVASRCNIDCDYCYVFSMGDSGWATMPKTMSQPTIRNVIRSLGDLSNDQDEGFATVLHGGEPLLLGNQLLRELLFGLRSVLPDECSISIQTNGTLIDNEFLDICVSTGTNLSISLDGPKHVNDVHRVSFSHDSTFEKTLAGIRKVQQHERKSDLLTGFLAVINPTTDPVEVYRFFKSINAPSLNFLYADGNHSRLPIGKSARDSAEYGEWLAKLWQEYIADSDPIPIRTLDDIARLAIGGRATKEGMGTSDYSIAVIETDGSISKNDTLKSTFNGADKFSTNWHLSSHRLSEVAASDEFASYVAMQKPSSEKCRHCELLQICGGGMPLTRYSESAGFSNESVYCADQVLIIKTVQESLRLVIE